MNKVYRDIAELRDINTASFESFAGSGAVFGLKFAGQTYGAVAITPTDIAGLDTVLDLKADLIGGKLDPSQVPDIAVVDYLGDSADEPAMLALDGEKGDWTTRTDLGTVWLITGDDPTDVNDWTQLSYPTAPVTSVAGLTGAISSANLKTALSLSSADLSDSANLQLKNGTLALGGFGSITGTLADARLSSNVPLLNAANVFTASQTLSFAGGVEMTLNNTADVRVWRFGMGAGSGVPSTTFTITDQTAGSPRLTIDTAGLVTLAGNLTVGGGTITGGASGLTLAAGGTNQNITLTPSGTGSVAVVGKQTIVTGTLADGQSGLRITSTLPSSATGFSRVLDVQATSNSNTQNAYAFNMNYLAGSTSATLQSAGRFSNVAAGTGADSTLLWAGAGNSGIITRAGATTAGYNFGARGQGANGARNFGIEGSAITNKDSGINVGVAGYALNGGTSPTHVGGFFGLMSAMPTFASAALMADNGATTSDILVARDNGSVVFKIADGGGATFGGGITPASMSDASAANGTFYISTDSGKASYKDSSGVVNAFY